METTQTETTWTKRAEDLEPDDHIHRFDPTTGMFEPYAIVKSVTLWRLNVELEIEPLPSASFPGQWIIWLIYSRSYIVTYKRAG